jgi:hypothetical protein
MTAKILPGDLTGVQQAIPGRSLQSVCASLAANALFCKRVLPSTPVNPKKVLEPALFIFSIVWQTTQWLAVSISGNSDWNNPTGHGLIVYTGHLTSRND